MIWGGEDMRKKAIELFQPLIGSASSLNDQEEEDGNDERKELVVDGEAYEVDISTMQLGSDINLLQSHVSSYYSSKSAAKFLKRGLN